MGFLNCILYMGFLGILSYPVGRYISHRDPDPDCFLFRERAWEAGGKIYEKLNIKKWQAKIPDISKVLGKWMPKKSLSGGFSPEKLRVMVRETCTAELVHGILSFLGLNIPRIWAGAGGKILCAVYVLLGNVPFILVQRYNRPRLRKMQLLLESKHTEPPKLPQAAENGE